MLKTWYRSKTIQGILIALVGFALRQVGVEIPKEMMSQALVELINLIPEIMQVGGLAYAGYGRVKASGTITLKKRG